jgi:prepilin-type N-terminal cleavage/methylation domain-containing protein
MKKNKLKNKAFTLIEVLVVSVIIGVLVTVTAVSFGNSQKNSRNARRKADLETVLQALVLYRQDHGDYGEINNGVAWQTRWTTVVNRLYTDGYLTTDTVMDPKGVDAYQVYCLLNSGSNCQRARLRVQLEPITGVYYEIFTP